MTATGSEASLVRAAAGVPRRRYRIYFMLFLLSVVAYIDRISISIANRPIAHEFGLSPVAMGYLLSAFSWSYLLCLVPVGMIADRFGVRRTICTCVALWSCMTMASGAVSSLFLLALTRLGLGVGESVTFPAGGRVLRRWSPASERGLAATAFVSGSYVGPAFGAALVGWLVGEVGWRGGFFVAGAIGLAVFLIWLFWYREPEAAAWLGETERRKILAERNPHSVRETNNGSSLLVLLRSRTLWSLAIAHGCGIYSQYLYLTWLPSYLQNVRGLTMLNSGLLMAVPYLVAALINVGMGWASDRMLDAAAASGGRRRNIMIVMSVVSAVILLIPFVDSTAAILALIAVSLSALSGIIALHFALMHDLLLDPQNAGKASAVIAVGGNAFGLAAPIVTGYIIKGTGSYDWAFGVAGMLLIAGAGLLFGARRPIDPVAA
jgi:ACS family glucarate transporter-like MFS transporter